LEKIIGKTRKTRKRNTLIVCKKTLDTIFLYTLRRISKNKRNKRNQQERNRSRGKQKILQNQNQKNFGKNKILTLIRAIIIDILL
jgi:hypothetical protein